MFNLAGIAVEGSSVGGLGTCIQLPGYDLAFDIGKCPRSAVQRSRVLVTHAHMDHLGALAQHCATRGLMGLSPPTYVVPAPIVPDLQALLAVWRRLDGSALACHIVPSRPGDRIPLGPGLVAQVVEVRHRRACQGYALLSGKNKLKAEYAHLSGPEIRDLRLSGVPVTDQTWTADVAFPGDTLLDSVFEQPVFGEARLLVLEATFLDDRVSVEAARDKGHVHLDEILARAEEFRNHHILLTHFSARYTDLEVREILHTRLPPELARRVTPLLFTPRTRTPP